MKILIMGAGAIGSLFGALLSKNHCVTLIGRDDHIDEINKNGLKITGKTSIKSKVPAFSSIDKINFSPDLILLTVKSYDTRNAVDEISKIFKENTLLLSLQNGLDNLEKIRLKIMKKQIILGTTNNGAIFNRPGVINHMGKGDTFIGGLDGKKTHRLMEIIDIFNQASIKTFFSENILKKIWVKAIVNSSINPITTFFETENGYLIENKILEKSVEKICEESTIIANTQGFKFSLEDMINTTKQVILNTKRNKSSMLQSFLMCKNTEIDSINGKFVEIGKK